MIAYLEGEIIAKFKNSLVIKSSQVGYKVFLSEKLLDSYKIADQAKFCLYQHLKEDTSDLYAFNNWSDVAMFELLLSVSGVGPKSALGILAIASVADIKAAVELGDSELLTKVAGIGKKTAARLVLELKNKLKDFQINQKESAMISSGSNDELEALISLGYSLAQAREALSLIDPELEGSSLRLKAALQIINKNK
jgi:holliday junction DNA helicase RuvA